MSPADTVLPCIAFTLAAELIFLSYRRSTETSSLASASERAQRRLAAAGAYFKVMFAVGSIVKLASHLGGLPADVQKLFVPMLGIPLLVAAMHYLKALWDLKREAATKPS